MQRTFAHSAAFPVIIDDQPFRIPEAVDKVRAKLVEQRNWYEANGKFPYDEARQRMLSLFDRAIEKLMDAS
ncbi:MAG: hypothetical protein AAF585_18630 [Verrucomicrobiota bacterium]